MSELMSEVLSNFMSKVIPADFTLFAEVTEVTEIAEIAEIADVAKPPATEIRKTKL